MKKKLVWIMLLAIMLTFFACKEDERGTVISCGKHLAFNSVDEMIKKIDEAGKKELDSRELDETEQWAVRLSSFPMPKNIPEEYELSRIALNDNRLTYTFKYEDSAMQNSKEIVVDFNISTYYNRISARQREVARIEEAGGELHKDGVYYNEKTATLYFLYDGLWASVYAPAEFNTYEQLLELSEIEIITVFRYDDPTFTIAS